MYNNKDRRTVKKKSPKQSPIKTKQQIAYSLFKAKVKMSQEDDFKECPFGFIYNF